MKIKDNIANEFDAFSTNYTQDMTGCVPYYTTLMSHFTNHLPKNFEPHEILDLGCGNGNVTATLLSKFSKAKYTLIDASKEMLHLCEQRFKYDKAQYVNSYFQDFQFKNLHFKILSHHLKLSLFRFSR